MRYDVKFHLNRSIGCGYTAFSMLQMAAVVAPSWIFKHLNGCTVCGSDKPRLLRRKGRSGHGLRQHPGRVLVGGNHHDDGRLRRRVPEDGLGQAGRRRVLRVRRARHRAADTDHRQQLRVLLQGAGRSRADDRATTTTRRHRRTQSTAVSGSSSGNGSSTARVRARVRRVRIRRILVAVFNRLINVAEENASKQSGNYRKQSYRPADPRRQCT